MLAKSFLPEPRRFHHWTDATLSPPAFLVNGVMQTAVVGMSAPNGNSSFQPGAYGYGGPNTGPFFHPHVQQ